MSKIQIMTGSVMGTALGVAKTAEQILTGLGYEVALYPVFDKTRFDPKAAILVCTSSTGVGDLPENIVPFYHFLQSEFPPIADTPYGVISLGDSSYPDFARAGNTIDEALADLGAVRTSETLVMDALMVDDHEEEASDWIYAWERSIRP